MAFNRHKAVNRRLPRSTFETQSCLIVMHPKPVQASLTFLILLPGHSRYN